MFRLNELRWDSPQYLYLLLLLPLIAAWFWYKYRKDYPVLRISSADGLGTLPKTIKQRLIPLLYVLRLLAIAFTIIGLARPQTVNHSKDFSIEGIDIVMAMDISTSMLAMDLKPNRLEAAKEVAINFIDDRPNDRIGAVIFAGEAFTQCPLTTDHKMLNRLIRGIKSGILEDGTAIGDGLATLINRLKDSKAVSKVAILLTDGENNRGSMDPHSAAEIAKNYHIRVYTIGVGTRGKAPYPVQGMMGQQVVQVDVNIDEDLLKDVAETTGGKYFRATNNRKLKSIYEEINELEKSKIDITKIENRSEAFYIFVLIALVLVISEFILKYLYIKTNP
jgi:Ca-activated chloride channel family protein